MAWEPPPLHRHLSTVGIGPVFIAPPPHPLPPPPFEAEPATGGHVASRAETPPRSPSNQSRALTVTWEIVGDIKTTPEDFIVREIGWAPPPVEHGGEKKDSRSKAKAGEPDSHIDIRYNTNTYRRRPGWTRGIAGTQCSSEEIHDTNDAEERGKIPATNKTTETSTSETALGSTVPSPEQSQIPPQSLATKPTAPPSTANIGDDKHIIRHIDLNPAEGLRRILLLCHQGTPDAQEKYADDTLQQLTELQQRGLEEIEQYSATSEDNVEGEHGRWIPTAALFQNSSAAHATGKEDWTLLHRYMRQAFPLLRTESSAVGPSSDTSHCNGESGEGGATEANGMGTDDGTSGSGNTDGNKAWVCVLVDRSFYPAAPYLSNPGDDLPLLYKLRNYGPIEGGQHRSRSRPCKRPKKNRKGQKPEEAGDSGDEAGDNAPTNPNSEGLVLLRLRPDLPRSERRAVHQLLASSRRREFETSTVPNVRLDYADKRSNQTTAIAVWWSFNAVKTAQKKRKRGGNGDRATDPPPARTADITATFCVLRKRQVEHQVALQNLARALRCRSGDIGLAGIKDRQAVTYQFCTLRNVDPVRARRANDALGQRMQLSCFREVQEVLLDRGKLLGNRFEITIRNLQRVQRSHVAGKESWQEGTIPLSASHLTAMVTRVRDFGFVNFYGEQRVGAAGFRSEVGVRSFDVGLAMLKRDFATAIDLIMVGRSTQVFSPGDDERQAREAWSRCQRAAVGDPPLPAPAGDTGSLESKARAALKAFPKNRNAMVRERDLMQGLVRYGGDALAAIRTVPYGVRMLWIHGYQSFVWNRIATERVSRFGLRPVVGDLYLRKSSSDDEGGAAVVQVVQDPSSVHISEIVLPLPGYNMRYPSNEIGELYRTILRDEGVELSKNDVPESTCKGSYRKLIQHANQLAWERVPAEGEDPLDAPEDRTVSAARFTFELESGCYATMMLRELMVSTMKREVQAQCKSLGERTNIC